MSLSQNSKTLDTAHDALSIPKPYIQEAERKKKRKEKKIFFQEKYKFQRKNRFSFQFKTVFFFNSSDQDVGIFLSF